MTALQIAWQLRNTVFLFFMVIFIKPITSYYAYYNALMQKNKIKIEKNNIFLKEIRKNRNYRARVRCRYGDVNRFSDRSGNGV